MTHFFLRNHEFTIRFFSGQTSLYTIQLQHGKVFGSSAICHTKQFYIKNVLYTQKIHPKTFYAKKLYKPFTLKKINVKTLPSHVVMHMRPGLNDIEIFQAVWSSDTAFVSKRCSSRNYMRRLPHDEVHTFCSVFFNQYDACHDPCNLKT